MKIYYIYHIPHFKRKRGKQGKIGCAYDLQRRVEDQGYTLSDCEILETHTDIHIASDREIELQREYGYPVDNIPYWLTLEHRRKGTTFETCSKGGKIGGKVSGRKHAESGHLIRCGQITKEKYGEPVRAYKNMTGEFVGEYGSQREAVRELGLSWGSVGRVLSGKYKQTGGYTFTRIEKNNSK